MGEAHPLTDPFWLEQPHTAGQAVDLTGDVEGVPWCATVVADQVPTGGLGWARIVSFAVGLHADAETLPFTPLRRPEAADIEALHGKAWNAAVRGLDDIERTRTFMRALHDGGVVIGDGKTRLRMDRPAKRELVRKAYTLAAQYGRRDSNRLIAQVTGWSISDIEKVVAELRRGGELGPAQRGRPSINEQEGTTNG